MLDFLITVLLCLSLPFIAALTIFFIYYYLKGLRFKPHTSRVVKFGSKLYRLYVKFPERLVLDTFNRDLDMFPEYGIRLICGEQGSGKTVTMAFCLNGIKSVIRNLRLRQTSDTYMKTLL